MATFRRAWFPSRAIAVLAALCLVSALAMAAPASATTPGKNGRIAFKGYLDADNSTGAIFTIRPDGTRARRSPSRPSARSMTSRTGHQTDR
jgi:hypothetical protein